MQAERAAGTKVRRLEAPVGFVGGPGASMARVENDGVWGGKAL